jgi:hypothetical protein
MLLTYIPNVSAPSNRTAVEEPSSVPLPTRGLIESEGLQRLKASRPQRMPCKRVDQTVAAGSSKATERRLALDVPVPLTWERRMTWLRGGRQYELSFQVYLVPFRCLPVTGRDEMSRSNEKRQSVRGVRGDRGETEILNKIRNLEAGI